MMHNCCHSYSWTLLVGYASPADLVMSAGAQQLGQLNVPVMHPHAACAADPPVPSMHPHPIAP